MHYRYLVTFNKEKAQNSKEAREYVARYLGEEGFCAQGRWANGLADWFVIGGRWSGELSRHSWAKTLYEQMTKIEREKDIQVWGCSYNIPEKKKAQKELEGHFNEMWRDKAPEEYRNIPVNRDTYTLLGYEDDAMILTKELYDGLLKEYAGDTESEHHADLDYDEVSPKMIGNKWVVVVDYHN